jgi:hypothetical protein
VTEADFNAATFSVDGGRATIIRPLNQPETAALLGLSRQAIAEAESRIYAKLSVALYGDTQIRTRDHAGMVRRVVRFGNRQRAKRLRAEGQP